MNETRCLFPFFFFAVIIYLFHKLPLQSIEQTINCSNEGRTEKEEDQEEMEEVINK